MIVRAGEESVLLITQPDHAALSRRIMEHWRSLADHPRRASILHAIGEHDNGWREPDQSPCIDATGRPVDFVNAPASVKQPVWPRGIARLAADPVAAALVAQHAVTVYDRFRINQEWVRFFEEMAASRDHFLALAGLPRGELLKDYAYVRLGDLISLTFCTGWRDEQTYDRWSVRLDEDTRVVVTPHEFDAPEIPIEVPARKLRDEPFKSDSEFRATLASAPQVTLRGIVTSDKERRPFRLC